MYQIRSGFHRSFVLLLVAGAFLAASSVVPGAASAQPGQAAQRNETTTVRTYDVDTLLSQVSREPVVIYRNEQPAKGFALRNNLLYDATVTPNLGMEIPLGLHTSLGVNAGFKWWNRFFPWDRDTEKAAKWRNLMIVPEFRYYPKVRGTGHFFGLNFVYTHYNAAALNFPVGTIYKEVRDLRLQGDLYGGGLFYGYSWRLGNRWRIEAEAGLGAGRYDQDVFECPYCGKQLRSEKGWTLLPRLGANIVYTFGKTYDVKQ